MMNGFEIMQNVSLEAVKAKNALVKSDLKYLSQSKLICSDREKLRSSG